MTIERSFAVPGLAVDGRSVDVDGHHRGHHTSHEGSRRFVGRVAAAHRWLLHDVHTAPGARYPAEYVRLCAGPSAAPPDHTAHVSRPTAAARHRGSRPPQRRAAHAHRPGRGGVDQSQVVAPGRHLSGQSFDHRADRRSGGLEPPVAGGSLGQVAKEVSRPGAGETDPGPGPRGSRAVPGRPPGIATRGHMVVDEHVQCREKGVQAGSHTRADGRPSPWSRPDSSSGPETAPAPPPRAGGPAAAAVRTPSPRRSRPRPRR